MPPFVQDTLVNKIIIEQTRNARVESSVRGRDYNISIRSSERFFIYFFVKKHTPSCGAQWKTVAGSPGGGAKRPCTCAPTRARFNVIRIGQEMFRPANNDYVACVSGETVWSDSVMTSNFGALNASNKKK